MNSKLTYESKEYLIKNIHQSNRDLKNKLLDLFGIEISHVTIGNFKKKIQENRLEMKYPADKDLISLVAKVYYSLRKKINGIEFRTNKMEKLTNNRFRIDIVKVMDEFSDSFFLDLLFSKNNVADLILPNIEKKIFRFEHPDPNKFKDDLEYQAYYYDADMANQYFYQYLYEDPSGCFSPKHEFKLRIPSYLLRSPPDFLAEDLIRRYFSIDIFDGELFQKRTGEVRFMSMDLQKREELRNQLQSLHSKDRLSKEHQMKKGKIIADFFYLLGFESLVTDVWKSFPEFKRYGNKRDIDVIAFSFATQGIILIEEISHFTKEDYHKLETIQNMFEIFSFLGEPSLWRVTYLIIARTSEIIKNEVTRLYENKNVVFWNLQTFKKNFLSLLEPNLSIKEDPPNFNWVLDHFPESPSSKNSYEGIYFKIMKELLGDAKKPKYEYS